MRRDESVFFFTLVDFLVTALFFGVVLYAMGMHAKTADAKETANARKAVESLKSAAGVSNITELTNVLTKLAPVKDIEPIVTSVRNVGGLPALVRIDSLIQSVGGIDSAVAILARARRGEGYGKPPCLFTLAAKGRKVPRLVATVWGSDSTITFTALTGALDTLLTELNLSYASVDTLSLLEFRQAFAKLPTLRTDCRYWIGFIERTPYVYARDAVNAGFVFVKR